MTDSIPASTPQLTQNLSIGRIVVKSTLAKWSGFVLTWTVLISVAPAMLAAETIKFHSQHILVVSKFDSIEMPDQAGHIIGMFQAKGVGVRRTGPQESPYKIEAWGTGDYRKDGAGKDRGYARFIFADGSSYDEDWAGTGSAGHDVGNRDVLQRDGTIQRDERRKQVRLRLTGGSHRLRSGRHRSSSHNRRLRAEPVPRHIQAKGWYLYWPVRGECIGEGHGMSTL